MIPYLMIVGLISSVRNEVSHKVEVSIFCWRQKKTSVQICALNGKLQGANERGTPSVPRMVEPTFREGGPEY